MSLLRLGFAWVRLMKCGRDVRSLTLFLELVIAQQHLV
jgi:hypothetical protein